MNKRASASNGATKTTRQGVRDLGNNTSRAARCPPHLSGGCQVVGYKTGDFDFRLRYSSLRCALFKMRGSLLMSVNAASS